MSEQNTLATAATAAPAAVTVRRKWWHRPGRPQEELIAPSKAPWAFTMGGRPAGLPLWALQLALLVVLLAAWQASSLLLRSIYISTPASVAASFVKAVVNLSIPNAFVTSLWQVAIAYVLGVSIAIAVGVAIGRSSLIEDALDPFVTFGNATPSIATLPLLIVWFHISPTGRIAFIVIVTIWPTLINTITGVKAVSHTYEKVGLACNLGRWQRTRKIALYAAMPNILAGMRLSLAHALTAMIISGQEVGENGLGGIAERFATYFQTSDLIAVVWSSTIFAVLAFWVLKQAERLLFPWIKATAAQ